MNSLNLDREAKSNAERRKTILVAGGAGFLGSHLCERFLTQGDEVICVDNFQTGDRRNLAEFSANPRLRILVHDITKPLTVRGRVDEIYNMACAASPPRYQARPIHTLMTNILGAQNLLNLASAKGARILQSSTSEVYGDPEIALQHEGYLGNVNTCGPRACYDEGKRAAETLFWEFGMHLGLEARIARIFNTYGPRMHPDDGRVVSNFIVQALRGEDLTINGNGLQTRSFCYVSDQIEGLVRLMASDEKMPVNIGNPGEFTMLELAQKVLVKTNAAVRLVHQPMPQDDPRQRRPDISRAQTILGWAPKIDLNEGLDATIAWYAERLSEDRAADALAS